MYWERQGDEQCTAPGNPKKQVMSLHTAAKAPEGDVNGEVVGEVRAGSYNELY